MKRKRSKRWIIAKAGNVRIPAYRFVDGRVCIVYYEAGKRVRKSFSDDTQAESEARLVAQKISALQEEVLKLTATDRESYLLAKAHLQFLSVSIHVAAEEYSRCRALLPREVSLPEVVDFYVKRMGKTRINHRVPQIAAEFIEAKDQDGISAHYRKCLRNDLKRFASAFSKKITDVTTADMERWLRGLGHCPRSRNNLRSTLITFFNFAKTRGYLPRDMKTEADFITRASVKGGDICIFTPAEMAKLFHAADRDNIPFLVLSALAGLRHAEVLRLDWEDIRWSQNCIEVGKDKSKTATRRLVPLLPSAANWLADYRGSEGKVCRYAREQRRVQRLAESKELGLTWRQNILRHSFISYRVAATQNVAQVALEAGNSPQMIFSNYRALVTPQDATDYFAIVPRNQLNAGIDFAI